MNDSTTQMEGKTIQSVSENYGNMYIIFTDNTFVKITANSEDPFCGAGLTISDVKSCE